MHSTRIYWVPAGLALAAIGVLVAYVRPNPSLETGTIAWWVPVAWLIAVVAVATLVRVAKARAARIAIAVAMLPFCYLLGWFGGLMFVPALLALLGAAVLAPGRALVVADRPTMPGPWALRT